MIVIFSPFSFFLFLFIYFMLYPFIILFSFLIFLSRSLLPLPHIIILSTFVDDVPFVTPPECIFVFSSPLLFFFTPTAASRFRKRFGGPPFYPFIFSPLSFFLIPKPQMVTIMTVIVTPSITTNPT